MTIDPRTLMLALPLVAAAWAGVPGGPLWITGKAPAWLLLAMPAGTTVLSVERYSVTLRGDDGLVAALYRSGARLVLPARLTGGVS